LPLSYVKQPWCETSVWVWLEQEEEHMRRGLICAAVGLALVATTAHAATDKDKDAQHTGGTAKGAAVGALAGHEVGSGHAAAGAATGAAIGHHDRAKAEKDQGKQ
jgi:hypothetical protein